VIPVKKYIWWPDGSRTVVEGNVDINATPANPTFEQWVLYGFTGMDITKWLRWGKPRGYPPPDLRPPGGAIANAREEQQYRDHPELLEEWFLVNPGARAQFDATTGLEYSESVGAFVGTLADTVARPADAAMIDVREVPADAQAATVMDGMGCDGCGSSSSSPGPLSVDPGPWIDSGPNVFPVAGGGDLLAPTGPAQAGGVDASVSVSWGTIVSLVLIALAAWWALNR
jgi:hypothetical protein